MKVWPLQRPDVPRTSSYILVKHMVHSHRKVYYKSQIRHQQRSKSFPSKLETIPNEKEDIIPASSQIRWARGHQQSHRMEMVMQRNSSVSRSCGWNSSWHMGEVNSSRTALQPLQALLTAGALLTFVFATPGQCQQLHSPHLMKNAVPLCL